MVSIGLVALIVLGQNFIKSFTFMANFQVIKSTTVDLREDFFFFLIGREDSF